MDNKLSFHTNMSPKHPMKWAIHNIPKSTSMAAALQISKVHSNKCCFLTTGRIFAVTEKEIISYHEKFVISQENYQNKKILNIDSRHKQK